MDGLFSPPPLITGLLGQEEAERLRKQSIGTGIVSALIGGLAAAPNYRYTGIAPILGQALQSGFQGMQGTYTSALENYQTQQKMLEAQRQQEQQRLREEAIASLTPEEQAIARIDPNTLGNLLVAKSRPIERKTAVVGNTLVDVATGQPVYQGQQERKTQTVGNQIVDVNTGEVVFTAPKDEKPPKTREVNVGNKILLINDETGQTIREFPIGLAPRPATEPSYTQQFDVEGRLFYVPNKPGTPVLDAQGRPTTEFVPEKVGAKKKAETARTESLNQTANTVLSKVDSALGKVSDWTAGYGGLLQYLPSTEARSLQADIKTIQANLGFAELAKMREQSPTGGALGQVAVKEIEFLQSTVASLDQFQDAASLRKALNEIRASYERWVAAVQGGQTQNTGSNVKLTPSEQNVLDKYK